VPLVFIQSFIAAGRDAKTFVHRQKRPVSKLCFSSFSFSVMAKWRHYVNVKSRMQGTMPRKRE
jgi:hypothetical protein